MYVYTCVCTCMYNMYVRIYIFMYVCVYKYVHVHVLVFPGVSKSAVNKVKADLEASPKENFSEEELQAVRPFI